MDVHGSDMLGRSIEDAMEKLNEGQKVAAALSSIDELTSPFETVGLGETMMRRIGWCLDHLAKGAAAVAGRRRGLREDSGKEVSSPPSIALPEAPLYDSGRAQRVEGENNRRGAIEANFYGLQGYSVKARAINEVEAVVSPELIQAPLENGNRAVTKSALRCLIPGVGPLLKRYRSLPPTDCPANFANRVLEALDITVRAEGGLPEDLPAAGPLLLAANHPFGGVDGLIVAALFARVRPDLKILANRELCRIAELRSLFIPVDVFGEKGNTINVAGLFAAMRHLESGGALAIFPAGAVSHWHSKLRRIIDPEWHPLIGRLTRTAGATVIPLFFEGRNSILFQAAGCLHPSLRTTLLPREMWRMRKRDVTLHIGTAVKPSLLSALRDDKARTAHLRASCYALGRTKGFSARDWRVPLAGVKRSASLLEEIGRLPLGRVLAEDGQFRVLHVAGNEAPSVMHEIGRLREETFRAVCEGSGKELDLDRYDSHYNHLVLWDKHKSLVAGGYRAFPFLPSEAPQAIKSLYTASLFSFKPEFFFRCGTSMEVGRAFVTLEYQRDYAPLMMLWKGIGRLATIFGVRTVFGPSSIGLVYAPESILMLRQHLEEQHFDLALSSLVQGRRVPKLFPGHNAPDVRGLDYKTVDSAVKDLEGGLGLPILFKHYLQLGGRIAAFHEDRRFGTIDALMVVDLATMPEKHFKRYVGEDGLPILREAYLAAHN
jgi:putative hemolysin